MAYDLQFETGDKQKIATENLYSWFNARTGYSVDTHNAVYASKETGFKFLFSFKLSETLTDISDCYFSIEVPAPEVIIHEAEREVAAFAKHFNVNVCDLTSSGSEYEPHDRERMLEGFAKHNRLNYYYQYGIGQQVPASLPRDVWNKAWQWNSNVDKLQSLKGDGIFVPRIMFIKMNRGIATAIAMPAPFDALIPEVDYIITAQFGPITFESVKASLATVKQEKEPSPHYVVSPVPAAFAEAFDSAKRANGMLSILRLAEVMVTELVDEARKQYEQEDSEKEMFQSAAVAYNTAKFQESLDLCNQINGTYAMNALMLRGVAKGELAMYDESLTDIEAFLQYDENNEMMLNVYGYFLCLQNRKAEGEKAYLKAMEIIDDRLKHEPHIHHLWSRKAYSLLGLNRTDEALAAAQEGMKIKDSDALLIQHLGRAYMHLGQYEEAKKWLEKSVLLDQHNPYGRFYLYKVLTHLGERTDAQTHGDYVGRISPHLSRML